MHRVMSSNSQTSDCSTRARLYFESSEGSPTMGKPKYPDGPVRCGIRGCPRKFSFVHKHKEHLLKQHGKRVKTATLMSSAETGRDLYKAKKSTAIQAQVSTLSPEEAINSMLYPARLPVVSQLIHHTLLLILTRNSFEIPTSFNIEMEPLTIENDKFTLTLQRGDAEVLRYTPAGEFWLLRNYICHGERGSIFVVQSRVKRLAKKKKIQTCGQLAVVKIIVSQTNEENSSILVEELNTNRKLKDSPHINLMIPKEIFALNLNTSQLLDLDSTDSNVNVNLHGFIIMDLADYGTLRNVFQHRPASMGQIKSIFRQLLEALIHLHSVVGISHNDIEPSNILLFRNDSTVATDSDGADLFTPKLADFSNAGPLNEMPIDWTPGYTAPEVLMEENFDNGEKSDLYSMWLCLLYALCGCEFFETVSKADEQAKKQDNKLVKSKAEKETERLRHLKKFGMNVYKSKDIEIIEGISKRVLKFKAKSSPTVEEILSNEFFL